MTSETNEAVSDPAVEAPVAWRCSWVFVMSRPPFKRAPEAMDFATRAMAEQKRDDLKQFGDDVTVCVTPVFRKMLDPTRKLAKRRSIESLGWPIQMPPPRLGRK